MNRNILNEFMAYKEEENDILSAMIGDLAKIVNDNEKEEAAAALILKKAKEFYEENPEDSVARKTFIFAMLSYLERKVGLKEEIEILLKYIQGNDVAYKNEADLEEVFKMLFSSKRDTENGLISLSKELARLYKI